MGDILGNAHLYDVAADKMICTAKLHAGRISVCTWNGHLLTSGGKDNSVVCWDTRTARSHIALRSHSSDVCGLAWSPNGTTLASGGNDNFAVIWDARASHRPRYVLEGHKA